MENPNSNSSLEDSFSARNSNPSISSFVQKTLELLSLERDAEIEESNVLHETLSDKELQNRGVCIQKLKIEEQKSGLGGRTLVKLYHFKPGIEVNLPANKFTVGDIVGLVEWKQKMSDKNTKQGVITRITNNRVTVAFDEFSEIDNMIENTIFSLHLLSNDVTFKRLRNAMKDLDKYREGPATRLLSVLFGEQKPSFTEDVKDLKLFNENLNESQIEAIKFGLTVKDVGLIHGPAGTGKTTTVVELMKQFVKRGLKVLACGPSNLSVDNMVEKLADSKIKMVRIGHPARVLKSVLDFSMDILIHNDENSKILNDIQDEMDKTLIQIEKSKSKDQKFSLRGQLKGLRKELQQVEQKRVDNIMKESQIILTTNSGAADRMIEKIQFDVVIIDEAAQAQEASCFIPLLKGKRLILAGDHCQLPPTVKSSEAEKKGLGITLFERLIKMYGEKVSKMLQIQYRMNTFIMKFSSLEFYQDKLIAHKSVANHLLMDLPNVKITNETKIPLLFIDTAGCECEESQVEEGESKSNPFEVEIVVKHLKLLFQAGVFPADIAIITPYNAQVNLLKKSLGKQYPTLEIGSVDGFQGREKECIVFSFVRSNPQHNFGFLSENRRTNVALTRAKRNLTLIGDSETISNNPFLKRMVNYFTKFGELRTAHEYLHDNLVLQEYTKEEFLEEMKNEKKLDFPSIEENKLEIKKKTKKIESEKKKDEKKKDDKKIDGGKKDEKKKEEKKIDSGKKDEKKIEKKDEAEIKSQFEIQLQNFISHSSQSFIDFPSTLNVFERKVIHELCEQLDLNHVSQGDGNNRFIRVSKKNGETQEKTDEEEEEEEEEEEKVEEKEEIKNKNQEKSDDEEEEEEKEENSKPENINQNQSKPKKKSKKKKSKSNVNPLIEEVAKNFSNLKTENDNNLIDEAISQNQFCAFQNCGHSILTLSRLCMFCKRKYCFLHGVAENHGCGEAAKKKAREDFAREAQNLISGKPSNTNKPLKDEDRKLLQNKLKKKLDESSSSRKPKANSNAKKK